MAMTSHLDLILAVEYTSMKAAALDACSFTRTLRVQADLIDLQIPYVDEGRIVGWRRKERTVMVRWIISSESVCVILYSRLVPIHTSV
jgi:hypothetical protein